MPSRTNFINNDSVLIPVDVSWLNKKDYTFGRHVCTYILFYTLVLYTINDITYILTRTDFDDSKKNNPKPNRQKD